MKHNVWAAVMFLLAALGSAENITSDNITSNITVLDNLTVGNLTVGNLTNNITTSESTTTITFAAITSNTIQPVEKNSDPLVAGMIGGVIGSVCVVGGLLCVNRIKLKSKQPTAAAINRYKNLQEIGRVI